VAFEVPTAVGRLLTADVAAQIARTFGDQVVFPHRVVVDCPPGFSRRFPGWPGPVLVLCDENQGVCSWGVPSGGGEVVVSAASQAALRQFTAGLLDLPGVGQALWSSDEDGERLLSDVRRLQR
jgi:hypothetical protein